MKNDQTTYFKYLSKKNYPMSMTLDLSSRGALFLSVNSLSNSNFYFDKGNKRSQTAHLRF